MFLLHIGEPCPCFAWSERTATFSLLLRLRYDLPALEMDLPFLPVLILHV